MAVPKHRTTKSRQLKRRQHIFLEKPNLVKCPNCGHFILPHTLCGHCGYYRNRKILDVAEELKKKEKKKREEKEKQKPLNLKELSQK